MANHPIPDSDPKHMLQNFGTKYLITDPHADKYLNQAYKNALREKKKIVDAWTI